MKIKTILLPNDDNPTVYNERRKMLANALQVIALGILAAAIIAPVFNPSLQPSFVTRFAGGLIAGVIELLALRVIGYISGKNDGEGEFLMIELLYGLVVTGGAFAAVLAAAFWWDRHRKSALPHGR